MRSTLDHWRVWLAALMITLAAAVSSGCADNGDDAKKITIGHFGNSTPFQIAMETGALEEATGWQIEWREFASGSEVIAAMASGDIRLTELGSSPLAIAASQGIDLQLILIAQGIGKAESLIVRDGAAIDRPEDLRGKRIAVPVGSTAHFSLMGALDHWGIGADEVTIMNMPPDQIAAAWERAAIDAAFIWQPVQSRLLQSGRRLVDAQTVGRWGYPTFDGWAVDRRFASEHPEFIAAFIGIAADANQAYLDERNAWTPQAEPVRTIAAATGAAPEQVPEILEGFVFLPLEEQLSAAWLGGGVEDALMSTAIFLQQTGRINAVRDDYAPFVNAGPLRDALAQRQSAQTAAGEER